MMVKSSIPPFEKVYTTKETAVRLKVSESFLNKKRVSGGGRSHQGGARRPLPGVGDQRIPVGTAPHLDLRCRPRMQWKR